MKIIDFYNRLNDLYPTSLSSSWDNDGLMCCPDDNAEVKKVLVALDATDAVLKAAEEGGFDTVLCHHPLIFKGLRALNSFDVVGRRVLRAVKAGISVISLHTRLDAGEGGVNDCLADALGLYSVETFGDEDNPTLGRIGRTEIAAPAEFAKKIKTALGAPSVCAHISGPTHRIAVVGGGGGDLISAARRAGADTLVTGESGYNKSLDSAESGINVFTAGHYYTEKVVLPRLASLTEELAGAEAVIYKEEPESFF